MDKFRVNIYKVTSMAEADVNARCASEAKLKALRVIKKIDKPQQMFIKPDCKYIALSFRESSGAMIGNAKRG